MMEVRRHFLVLKKINVSVRAERDHKYFREVKKYLSYSDHTGCTFYDQAVLTVENCHSLVLSTVWNICEIQSSC